MKLGKTIDELEIELLRQNDQKKDFLVDTRQLRFSPEERGMSLKIFDSPNDSDYLKKLNVGDIAHRQIGAKLNIPAKYYAKMQTEYPELLAENVNAWFGKEPKVGMIRTLYGSARAFLSNRYRRIDNMEIALAVIPLLKGTPGLRIASCELTEQKMYIKAINERLETEVTKGDIVQSGVVITNSEVGLGSVMVSPLIYRLVCTNGMIAADSGVNKRHIGRINTSEDEDYSLYRDETLKADDQAFLLKIQDIVGVVSDELQFNKVVDKMREAAGVSITGNDIPHVVELTSKEFGFTQDENSKILQHLFEARDYTKYGLANAVTRTAEDVPNYDRASEIEAEGFGVVTMDDLIWRRINAA
jgi:hypothetical protein